MRHVLFLSGTCLAILGGCRAASSDQTRENLIAGYTSVLKAWDKDRDGKLSQTEVSAMLNESFRRTSEYKSQGKLTKDLERDRQMFLSYYASQDANQDGYLSLDEFLKEQLAIFDCLDDDHDERVSREDTFRGKEKCPMPNLNDYAPKP
ncbi:MAG TPA: hypothetical protein VFH89_05740 [Sphingomicrobium sp.]|nr:hypothetical protein [Sphingomicrobium sp.]